MNNLNRAFQEIGKSSSRSFFYIFTLFLNYISLAILIIFIFSTYNVVNFFKSKPEVVAFMKMDVDEPKILEFKSQLEQDVFIESVTYTSKDKAVQNFIEQYKDNKDILEELSEGVLPAHLNIKPVDIESLKKIIVNLENNELVDKVATSEQVVDSISRIILIIQAVALVVFIAFSLNSFFVSILLTGLSIFQRKKEIEIMSLIGATKGYIKAPYIYSSLLLNVIAIFLAIIVVIPFIIFVFNPFMNNIFTNVELINITDKDYLYGGLILFSYAIILTYISTRVAIGRYLKYL